MVTGSAAPVAVGFTSFIKEDTDRIVASEHLRQAGFINQMWSLIEIGFILGGLFLTYLGIMWQKTAEIAKFFGLEWNPDRGFWVMMCGFTMLVTGIALLYI